MANVKQMLKDRVKQQAAKQAAIKAEAERLRAEKAAKPAS